MHYEPTEAELNGLSGDETADTEAAAAFYAQQEATREEWERQAYYHARQQEDYAEGEYEQLLAEVEGY